LILEISGLLILYDGITSEPSNICEDSSILFIHGCYDHFVIHKIDGLYCLYSTSWKSVGILTFIEKMFGYSLNDKLLLSNYHLFKILDNKQLFVEYIYCCGNFYLIKSFNKYYIFGQKTHKFIFKPYLLTFYPFNYKIYTISCTNQNLVVLTTSG